MNARLDRLRWDASPTLFGQDYLAGNVKRQDADEVDFIRHNQIARLAFQERLGGKSDNTNTELQDWKQGKAEESHEQPMCPEDAEELSSEGVSEELEQTLVALAETRKDNCELSKAIDQVSEDILRLQNLDVGDETQELSAAELCQSLPHFLPKDYSEKIVGIIQAMEEIRN